MTFYGIFCPAGLLGGEFPVNVSTKICGMCNRQGWFFTIENLSQSTTFHDHEFFTVKNVSRLNMFMLKKFSRLKIFTVKSFSRLIIFHGKEHVTVNDFSRLIIIHGQVF